MLQTKCGCVLVTLLSLFQGPNNFTHSVVFAVASSIWRWRCAYQKSTSKAAVISPVAPRQVWLVLGHQSGNPWVSIASANDGSVGAEGELTIYTPFGPSLYDPGIKPCLLLKIFPQQVSSNCAVRQIKLPDFQPQRKVEVAYFLIMRNRLSMPVNHRRGNSTLPSGHPHPTIVSASKLPTLTVYPNLLVT